MTQAEALAILKTGANVFLTGAAGSGKSFLLNQYIDYLNKKQVNVAITASTGIAATHIGGTTIHSWTGLGVRNSLNDADIRTLLSRAYLKKRFDKANVLIIDEISMLECNYFSLINQFLRAAKQPFQAFGGLQVILCGDFFQLPPISKAGQTPARFVFHSDAWNDLELKTCYLSEQHRQSDTELLSVLNDIREREVSEETAMLLQSRIGLNPPEESRPTRLYPRNLNVDIENERELAKLPGKLVQYSMEGKGPPALTEALERGCLAPKVLSLKVGAKVMFVKNNLEEGYANGTLGTVLICNDNEIVVRTFGGDKISVPYETWFVEEEGKVKAEISQFPLRLAWAFTIHKSQGMSLEAAEIDLSQSFEKGMGYVALSRVRSLSGLFLKGLAPHALELHDEAIEFDRTSKDESAKTTRKLGSWSKEELGDQQKVFLSRVAPRVPSATKADTFRLTAELLNQGLGIKEIASRRDLTEGTVVNHIEKLLERNANLDIEFLRYEVPGSKFQTIYEAFQDFGADEKGAYSLSPIRQKLGDGYSFDEIRMVRLFLMAKK